MAVLRGRAVTPEAIVAVGIWEEGEIEMWVRRERSRIQPREGRVDQGELPPDFGTKGMLFLIA